MESKICLQCGKEFEVYPSKVNRKYCSMECSGKSKRGIKTWNTGTKGVMKSWCKGKKFPERSGENAYNWIKDRTKLKKKQERNDVAYQDWRKNVLERDGYRCKICGLKMDKDNKLVVHHILPWKDFPEERYNINNGITLCNPHHPRKREYEEGLIPEFQKLVGSRETI